MSLQSQHSVVNAGVLSKLSGSLLDRLSADGRSLLLSRRGATKHGIKSRHGSTKTALSSSLLLRAIDVPKLPSQRKQISSFFFSCGLNTVASQLAEEDLGMHVIEQLVVSVSRVRQSLRVL